ncbi:MAG: carbon starvation protein A [Rikenellaceae bacterium]|nr:carbon starvation protein A [Rikenellaceae bacterium]
MITFLACLALLAASYFGYGRYLERLAVADQKAATPCRSRFDGVDYVPMPQWKTFLIQLLNIAGLGPIFGAVLGATYGPVAFIWITLGGILFGATHDYFAGMISLRNGGASLPEIIGKYLGRNMQQFLRLFTVVLMVLVGAVFIDGPAGLLGGMTGLIKPWWVAIILAYYIVATLLPIDKIIGKIYPVFGAALIFTAVGVMGALIFGDMQIPELTSFANMKSNAASFPVVPTLFVTIACGAISGFHATQSPLMARCMTGEKQGRGVFFGAMISESIIALVWAAAAMAFFGGAGGLNAALTEHGGSAAWAVETISNTTLGRVGGLLVLIGVVVAPISTGDTAFRSARLIVADFMRIDQRRLAKRIRICLPLFAVGYAITLMPFDVIWRYFAWTNQTLSVATLWMITVYLSGRGKNIYVALLPALFMTMICASYLFVGREMIGMDYTAGMALGGAVTLGVLLLFVRYMRKR